MGQILDHLQYTKEHEWLQTQGEVSIIGITDFAQNALGDIIYVELPEKGTLIKQGQPFGVVESIKSVSDLYTPISGEIIEVNKTLIDSPERINQDPYNSWMIKVKILKKETDQLMNSTEYYNFCSKES